MDDSLDTLGVRSRYRRVETVGEYLLFVGLLLPFLGFGAGDAFLNGSVMLFSIGLLAGVPMAAIGAVLIAAAKFAAWRRHS